MKDGKKKTSTFVNELSFGVKKRCIVNDRTNGWL
nr:hypothetical protein [Tanacetum cinerariifolium]